MQVHECHLNLASYPRPHSFTAVLQLHLSCMLYCQSSLVLSMASTGSVEGVVPRLTGSWGVGSTACLYKFSMSSHQPTQGVSACTTRHVADSAQTWVTWNSYHHTILWINPTTACTLAEIAELHSSINREGYSTIEVQDRHYYILFKSGEMDMIHTPGVTLHSNCCMTENNLL